MDLRYDRLTRLVKFDVDGEEYASRLTVGQIGEIEDVALKSFGKPIMKLFQEQEDPSVPMMIKAFCIGLTKDGKKVKPQEAYQLFLKICEKHGMPHMERLYLALIASSYFLGADASQEILESLGLDVKDTEEAEKNA